MEDDTCSNIATILKNKEEIQTNDDKNNNNVAAGLDHQIESKGVTDITPKNNNVISTKPGELIGPREIKIIAM